MQLVTGPANGQWLPRLERQLGGSKKLASLGKDVAVALTCKGLAMLCGHEVVENEIWTDADMLRWHLEVTCEEAQTQTQAQSLTLPT